MSRNKKRKRNKIVQNTQKVNKNVTERNVEYDTERKTGKKSTFFAKFKNTWRSLPKKILKIIMDIFSYSFIFTLLLFAYGKISGDNRSDNDLLKKQIDENVGNGKITSILKEDLHGFGNDSIIVTIGNQEFLSQDIQNKILIMDTVQNEILSTMNDFLNLKSPYKIRFSYILNNKLRDERIDLHPQIDSVIDIIGESDLDKEIIVKYGICGHKSKYMENVEYVAIFRYSYKKTKYELIGTYPTCDKLNVRTYKEDGKGYSIDVQEIHTDFDNVSGKGETSLLFFDDEKQFSLTEMYNMEYSDFWVDSRAWGKVLVLAKLDRDKWTTLVNCYYPVFDENTYELSWNAIYSEEMPIPEGIFREEILHKLLEDLDDTMELVN